MRVELSGVTKGHDAEDLPATSTTFDSGTVTLAVAETEQRPTVLGLIASGRMRPDSGTVTIDGRADARALRRGVALVDAPGVSDPDAGVPLVGVVAEELMFAGRRADPLSARRWLDAAGFRSLASTAIADIEPITRLRVLCELAVLRPHVEALVVTAPDRHGGQPLDWWTLFGEFADRGLAVLAVAGRASEWAITHADVIERAESAEASLRNSLGAFDERSAAWAQSGGGVGVDNV
ncbi:ABC transporter ATP-binding protein [Salinibacterium sp. NYA9b]